MTHAQQIWTKFVSTARRHRKKQKKQRGSRGGGGTLDLKGVTLNASVLQHIMDQCQEFFTKKEENKSTSNRLAKSERPRQVQVECIKLDPCRLTDPLAAIYFVALLIMSNVREIWFMLQDLSSDRHMAMLTDMILPCLHHLNRLQHVTFFRCHTRDPGVHLSTIRSFSSSVATTLGTASNITSLTFFACDFQPRGNNDELFQSILDGIAGHRRGLEQIDLSACNLGDGELKRVVQAICNSPSHNTIQQLSLTKNDVRWESFASLATLLRKCSNLWELDLEHWDNLFCPPSSAPELPQSESSRVLPNWNTPAFVDFVKALKAHKNLHSLNLDGCGITDEWARFLVSESLYGSKKSSALSLGQLSIRSDDLLTTSLQLQSCQHLETLHVNLDWTIPKIRTDVWNNTSLTRIRGGSFDDTTSNCSIMADEEDYLCFADRSKSASWLAQICERNQLLRQVRDRVLPNVQEEHYKRREQERRTLPPSLWPMLMERKLAQRTVDKTPLYTVLQTVLPSVVGGHQRLKKKRLLQAAQGDKRPRRIHQDLRP